MKKYTPGPWSAVLLNDESDQSYVEMHETEFGDADMCIASACIFASPLSSEIQERMHANITLAAAAPDLFEALELIIPLAKAAYINAPPEEGNYKGAKKTRDRWIEVAEAALAKAKGEPTCSPE